MKFYKAARWAFLAIALTILLLLFRTPQRVAAQQPIPTAVVKNAKSFQSKLGELEAAHIRGETGAVTRLTADEVSAAVTMGNAQSPPVTTASDSPAEMTPEQVPVKDTQVVFEGDEVKCQFAAHVYGRDMVVTLSARLGAQAGYVTFKPTSFKIGSMPMPISLVQAQLDKKLSEPETREKLKLPEFVSDLRIEDGQLVIVEK